MPGSASDKEIKAEKFSPTQDCSYANFQTLVKFRHIKSSDDGPVYGTRNVHTDKPRRYKTQSLRSMV